jgi:4'-phosphopantetheinyl transferase
MKRFDRRGTTAAAYTAGSSAVVTRLSARTPTALRQTKISLVPTHDVQIWFRPTASLDEADIAAAESVLSDDERARFRRFHFAHDARDYAAAHALLRRTLSCYDDREPQRWRFDKTPNGKPFLTDAGDFHASFSLSHARGMVACAVTADADVGVDVESVDRDVDAAGIAARFFAPEEAAHLMSLDPVLRRARFFDFWTLKEALVKALGAGMALSLNRLAFTVAPDGAVGLTAPADVDPQAWQFGLFVPGPTHRLAVAVRRSAAHTARLIVRSAADQT